MMKEIIWILQRWRYQFSPGKLIKEWYKECTAWLSFWKSYNQYKELSGIHDNTLLRDLYPCLGDDTAQTSIEPIYFYQDTWAFEKIVDKSPKNHVDVGSHHKFVAFLSKVCSVTMVDIRPLSLPLDSLKFQEGTILDLPFPDKSIESLSSLCVVEHIGLGRYGDTLDPNGSEKALLELKRVIAPDGYLYISLPIDEKNKTFFNAHRAFEDSYIKKLLFPLEIVEKRYIMGAKLVAEKPSGFCIALYLAVKPS